MIWQNWDPFKKNKREALIKKMVLKRLGDEIRLSLCLVEESICHETDLTLTARPLTRPLPLISRNRLTTPGR